MKSYIKYMFFNSAITVCFWAFGAAAFFIPELIVLIPFLLVLMITEDLLKGMEERIMSKLERKEKFDEFYEEHG